MSEWLTAAEIAHYRLPSLPASKAGVQKLSQRENWSEAISPTGEVLARRRRGAGGGLEYHVSLLPAAARVALKARALKAADDHPVIVQPQPELFSENELVRRDARLALLAMADAHFAQHRSLGLTAADHDFAARYNQAQIEAPAWLRKELPYASRRSLARWRTMREQGNWHGIGNGYVKRRGGALGSAHKGEVASYIGGLLVKQPFLTSFHIRDLVEARFALSPLPSVRSFQRFVDDWKQRNQVALAKLTNPDNYKSAMRLAGSNAYAYVRRLNQLWEIDASPADVLCTDGRYSLYALVDVWSRRMACYVTRTPRSEAALLLLRRAITAWGVPEMLRTDNGGDFTSRQVVRALNALGIVQDVTNPFSPEEKGIIERHIGTLQRGLMPLLPGFIGHSVADRKQIEARKAFAARLGESDEKTFCVDLAHTELQSAIDRWCTDKYARTAHDGLDGATPFARAASYTGTLRKIENLRALDLCLAPVAGGDGWRTVTKQGIRLDAGWYIAAELLAGARVFVRQDPEDMGRVLAFESETGAFVAEAICPARAGVDPRQAVAAARQAQADLIRDRMQDMRREAKAIKPRDMVDAVLGLAARKSASVTAFRRPAEVHETPALMNAAAAIGSAGVPPASCARDARAPEDNVIALPETPKQRFRRALAIRAAIPQGREVATEDARWLGSYEQSAECKAQQAMFEDFGSQWLEA